MSSRGRAAYVSALVLLIAGGGITSFALTLFSDGKPRSGRGEIEPSVATPLAASPSAGGRVHSQAQAQTLPQHQGPTDQPELERAHDPHPHPITPAHERLRRERHFVAGLDDAMDTRNAALLRETLEQYRREFPEDHQRLQSGYAVIADCLEHGERARAAAQRYYEENRGSTLRRWVRRICLEPRS